MQTALSFIIAFILALALTPVMRGLARRVGAVVYPNQRSVHKVPIPHLGGTAIYLASVTAILLTRPHDKVTEYGIIFGGLVIFLVGLIDDFLTLKPWQKVLGQIFSAATVVYLGVSITFVKDPLSGTIRFLGPLAIPLTLFWVVSFENLINLSDGLDGLAAGIVGITALVTVFASAKVGVPSVCPLAAAVAGSVIGFLPYNFHPASIFMGDAGAMYLGLALSVLSVQGLVKSTVAMAVLAPLLALLVPISDAAFAIVRRRSSGVPVSLADRDHIHHRLLELGMGQRQAVMAIYVVSLVFGALGLFSTFLPVSESGPITGLAVLGLFFFAHKMGLFTVRHTRSEQKEVQKKSRRF